MSTQAFILYLVAVGLISLVFTWLATRYASYRGMLDHPGERHSHIQATPRGGGAGIEIAVVAGSLYLWLTLGHSAMLVLLVPLSLLLALTGWWDDHISLSARLRFAIQVIVGSLFLAGAASHGWVSGWALMLLALLFIVWTTNLYNFMDGSNGMAGLQGVFAGGVLASLFWLARDESAALLAVTISAACVGFLPWNLVRPRVFMGDVGSLALGFLFAGLIVYGWGTSAFSLPVGLMVLLVFLLDASLTLLGRVLRGEQWYNAHKQHLYQRLIARGWPHETVAALYMGVNVCLLLPALVIASRYPSLAWPLAGLCTSLLCVVWLVTINRIGVNAAAK